MINPPFKQSSQTDNSAGCVAIDSATLAVVESVSATKALPDTDIIESVAICANSGMDIVCYGWFIVVNCGLNQACFISRDGFLQSHIQGIGYEGVAYRHFVEVG